MIECIIGIIASVGAIIMVNKFFKFILTDDFIDIKNKTK